MHIYCKNYCVGKLFSDFIIINKKKIREIRKWGLGIVVGLPPSFIPIPKSPTDPQSPSFFSKKCLTIF